MGYPSRSLTNSGQPDLNYKSDLSRNISSRILTIAAGLFTTISVLPLFLVLTYIIIKGGSKLGIQLFLETPPPPGLDGGGIGSALMGTLILTIIAALVAIPVGVGGGIYLAEYSRGKKFSQFVRFGTNVLSGVPSIISGVFIYGTVVVLSNWLFQRSFSAIAGGLALSILMIPTIIKTTDEGLKLVPDELRRAAFGVGASRFVTVMKITLPSAFPSIATGIVLGIARAAGETAPLIFTASFSYFWPARSIGEFFSEGLLSPISSLSVLIYNFAGMPYDAQQELAWVASFVLVIMILLLNLVARWLARLTTRR